ncbi:tRNA nucleotidyltransferase/poly(A) polymerase [Siphonobacter sp. BAB-5404]|nr:tRNA nucleotidyltransferase/poly(A) polymerase [Siphonobacter sp. SORGH_AS_0500]
MNELIKNHPVFQIIARSAEQLNLPTYVIGGYVRDLLLNRPSKDIDIVCVGSGIALAEQVARNSGDKQASLAVFQKFRHGPGKV